MKIEYRIKQDKIRITWIIKKNWIFKKEKEGDQICSEKRVVSCSGFAFGYACTLTLLLLLRKGSLLWDHVPIGLRCVNCTSKDPQTVQGLRMQRQRSNIYPIEFHWWPPQHQRNSTKHFVSHPCGLMVSCLKLIEL